MVAGVYLHIPFCRSRCSYCDFATDVYRSGEAVERYVAALCKEIATYRERVGATVGGGRVSANIDTVYFGGGTPSLLAPRQVESILNEVRSTFSVASASEITMEMNPATVTPETLEEYRNLGVNRASFGVQTFDDTELKRLARGHNAQDARDTFRMLRDAGYGNISFDLIAGLPRQTLADWERNLDEALTMRPEHLSLYLLEIHESTPLAEQIRSERQPLPDEELAAEMYEMMLSKVAAAGYEQYEISNFARPGFESRHNSKYWTLDPVYGLGVSAHSFDGSERYANDRDTNAYVKKIEAKVAVEVMRETVDLASEFIFLGLRLNQGISFEEFRRRFGDELRERYPVEIADLSDKGLISVSNERMRLTDKGMLFSNEVFAAFV
jgi:oxygen-independent coproporphyrinogen III oxidase